jgi:hypothetical protein
MTNDPVAELLNDPRFKGAPITWEITPEGYDKIRRAWLTHVQAEEWWGTKVSASWGRNDPVKFSPEPNRSARSR